MGQQCQTCQGPATTHEFCEVEAFQSYNIEQSVSRELLPTLLPKVPSSVDLVKPSDKLVVEILSPASLSTGVHTDASQVESDTETYATQNMEDDRMNERGLVVAFVMECKDELSTIQLLCRQAKVLEAGKRLTDLEVDVAAALKMATHDTLASLVQLQERIATDRVLKKLRLMQPRIEAQLRGDGLLSMALRGETWIVGRIKDPSIGEHFDLEIKVRWLEGAEVLPGGPSCQFILSCTASGWPQPVQDMVAMARELDLGSTELVEDCKDWKGTPGGPEQLMSSMARYVIRPSLCPVNVEFVLCKEFCVMDDAPIEGYPSGVMIVEEAMPTGVKDWEGWDIPPTSRGNYRVSQSLVCHVAPDPDHPNCTKTTQVGRYGAGIPKWMTPLSLIHKVCQSTIHKTLRRLIVRQIPKWNETYGPRMQKPEVKDLYSHIATLQERDGC